MITEYERYITYISKPATGIFKHQDWLQIYSSGRKKLKIGETVYFPVCVEFKFERPQSVYFRNSFPIGRDPLSRKIIEIQQVLSIGTQFHFDHFVRSKQPIAQLSRKKLPPVPEVSIANYQDRTLIDRTQKHFVIPTYLGDFLTGYRKLNRQDYLTFRKAGYLFNSGVGTRLSSPSLSFTAFISAIETLVNADKYNAEKCIACGQKRFQASRRFRDFVISNGLAGWEPQTAKQIAKKLYEYRSNLLHNGQLLVADMYWDEEAYQQDFEEHDEQRLIHKALLEITRASLINWTLSRVPSQA